MNNFRVLAIVSVFTMAPIVITGCEKATGGGVLETYAGNATFGFQAQCHDIGYPVDQVTPDLYVGQVTGEFQYKEKSSGVAFHGDMDIIPFEYSYDLTSCEVIDQIFAAEGLPNAFLMAGTYTPVPKTAGAGGQVVVDVIDSDIENCPNGDALAVELSGGIYSGYYTEACLEHGNIVVHGE